MIDGDEVRAINPYLSEEVIGASWCPTDGHANPLKSTYAYYTAARRLGVRFYSGCPVLELRKVKGELRQVVTPEGTFEAGSVVVAAGYASRKILNTVGIDVPMSNVLIEALVTEMEPPMFKQMLGTADADFYGHQTSHGSFVFGGDSGFETVNEDNGHDRTTSVTAPAICRGILRYIPKLANAKIVRTWAGFEDVCIDGVPVLGPRGRGPRPGGCLRVHRPRLWHLSHRGQTWQTHPRSPLGSTTLSRSRWDSSSR